MKGCFIALTNIVIIIGSLKIDLKVTNFGKVVYAKKLIINVMLAPEKFTSIFCSHPRSTYTEPDGLLTLYGRK